MARRPAGSKGSGRGKHGSTGSRESSAKAIRSGTSEIGEIALHTLGAVADAPRPFGTATQAKTVVYIHGIGNKPPASVLKCQWDTALFGAQLGDRSRMAYWVNREYYPAPLDDTCSSGDLVRVDDDQASTKAIMAIAEASAGSEAEALSNELRALTNGDEGQARILGAIAARIQAKAAASEPDPAVSAAAVGALIFPLPEAARRFLAAKLTRAFLRDVNDFLFVAERRRAMEQAFIDRLDAGGGPFVVVAHSQGTMIAYDVLRRLKPEQCDVRLFVTIGSPLGMQEVQDQLKAWSGGVLGIPACVRHWVNVADSIDPVAIDSDLSDDFPGVENHAAPFLNPDSPWHPHSGTGYLRTTFVRDAVREVVGNGFQQLLAPFAIAKDLADVLEDAPREARHTTLIQLAEDRPALPGAAKPLKETSRAVVRQIKEMLAAQGVDEADAQIEPLRHYIAAQLTRKELETLRSRYSDLNISGIWRDAAKRSLINDSTNTVQAKPANLGYGADGRNICWAVLDTGIRADHPHFKRFSNVGRQWDCTAPGQPVEVMRTDPRFAALDDNGHGTHVAGIIAGDFTALDANNVETRYAGMAPRCTLFGFKVLDSRGSGRDSWIIKALDKVASLNEEAGQLVVHGLNLSLGGSFDPSVFGCGHTPLCQELRRLWQQGVVICLAAGNEGYAILSGSAGAVEANLDLSIGDPANLEEAIAVGSVHKTNPHTYGISFFSSRGPTADGRRKPDVVAPGEKIKSARHSWPSGNPAANAVEDLYVEMSGTSMATPHVSGVLAAFLSHRREFIGYPDRVKGFLLAGSVDLRRDVYAQGAGLPNLIKMLALN